MPNFNLVSMSDQALMKSQIIGPEEGTPSSGGASIMQLTCGLGKSGANGADADDWSAVWQHATTRNARQEMIGQSVHGFSDEEKAQTTGALLGGPVSQPSGKNGIPTGIDNQLPGPSQFAAQSVEDEEVMAAMVMGFPVIENQTQNVVVADGEAVSSGSNAPLEASAPFEFGKASGVSSTAPGSAMSGQAAILEMIGGAFQSNNQSSLMNGDDSSVFFGKQVSSAASLLGQLIQTTTATIPFGGELSDLGMGGAEQATSIMDGSVDLTAAAKMGLLTNPGGDLFTDMTADQALHGSFIGQSEAPAEGMVTPTTTTETTPFFGMNGTPSALAEQSQVVATASQLDALTIGSMITEETVEMEVFQPKSAAADSATAGLLATRQQAVRQLVWQDLQARLFGQIKQEAGVNSVSTPITNESQAQGANRLMGPESTVLTTISEAGLKTMAEKSPVIAKAIPVVLAETATVAVQSSSASNPTVVESALSLNESTAATIAMEGAGELSRGRRFSTAASPKAVLEGHHSSALTSTASSVDSSQEDNSPTPQVKEGFRSSESSDLTVKTAAGRRGSARPVNQSASLPQDANLQTVSGGKQTMTSAAVLDESGSLTSAPVNEGVGGNGHSAIHSASAAAVSSTGHPRTIDAFVGPQAVESHGKELAESIQTIEKLTAITSRALLHKTQQGGGSMRLQLEPPELGHMKLEIQVSKEGVKAEAIVENGLVRQALLDNLPQLRQVLADKGLDLQRFDVFQQSSQHTDREGWTEGQASGNGYRRAFEDPSEEASAVNRQRHTSYAMRGITGNINLFA